MTYCLTKADTENKRKNIFLDFLTTTGIKNNFRRKHKFPADTASPASNLMMETVLTCTCWEE